MTILPVCVDNQRHGRFFGLDVDGPNGMLPLFAGVVDTVLTHQTVLVFKD